MTSKDFSKVKNQLGQKPAKWKKYEKHNAPRARPAAKTIKKCNFCGSTRGIVGQYGLNICRRCFRLNATKLGFKRLN